MKTKGDETSDGTPLPLHGFQEVGMCADAHRVRTNSSGSFAAIRACLVRSGRHRGIGSRR